MPGALRHFAGHTCALHIAVMSGIGYSITKCHPEEHNF